MTLAQPRRERIAPRPEVLVESLRDIGYSMTTAVADVIDNSITAGAGTISLLCDTADDTPAICIIDDGCGMTESELREAMRPGSRSPRLGRAEGDLGRFGLGLKTASFSQCRRLTVLTRRDGNVSGAVWDLDVIAETSDWTVEWVDEPASIRWADQLPPCGTLVLWEKLDRPSSSDSGRTLNRLVEEVSDHLRIAFHRFMKAEGSHRAIRFTLNGLELAPQDPFAEWHPATERSAEEVITVGSVRTVVQAFTLPHPSKCTQSQLKRIGGDLGHLRSQGFYLYRSRRLIVRGTWFRLAQQAEMTKLSRVRIDIGNDADEDWGIDVRKSSAAPPPAIRERLGRLIEQMGGSSRRTYRRRGVRLTDENPMPMWSRITSGKGAAYDLNPDHPVLRSLAGKLGPEGAGDLRRALSFIASSLPLDALFHDLASMPNDVSAGRIDREDVENAARETIARLVESGMRAEEAARMLSAVPPFKRHLEALTCAVEKLSEC